MSSNVIFINIIIVVIIIVVIIIIIVIFLLLLFLLLLVLSVIANKLEIIDIYRKANNLCSIIFSARKTIKSSGNNSLVKRKGSINN